MDDYSLLRLLPGEYQPTSRRSGLPDPTLLRVRNMMLTGLEGQIYLQCYQGNIDLAENIEMGASMNLTGTLTGSSGSVSIVGTGTLFLSELRSGQFFFAGSEVCMVDQITDDTNLTICRALTAALVAVTAKWMPTLFEIDRKRGTLTQGNAYMFDKGNILGTGRGTLRINNAVLAGPGGSMVLTGTPKIAIYYQRNSITAATNANPVVLTTSTAHGLVTGQSVTISGGTGAWAAINGTFVVTAITSTTFSIPVDSTAFGALAGAPVYPAGYTTYALGFTVPTTSPVMTSVAGGTHGMIAGTSASLRMVPSRTATGGYGNPGPKVPFTITSASDRAKADVTAGPAMDTAKGQREWDVYVTTALEDKQGPWEFLRTVTDSEIFAAPNFFYVDYLDAEVARNGVLDFNNDAPPAAGYIAVLEGFPIYISCNGKTGGSPGPSIQPGKFDNIEAAPADWNVRSSPPEDLLGVTQAEARLYIPTSASLLQTVYNPTGDPTIPPVSLRPWWRSGFAHHKQLIFANGMLIGAPRGGPTRSLADGEEANEQFFGDMVAEIWQSWTGQHVFVEQDPDPAVQAVCFFNPAESKNAAGFWRTRVLVWGLRQNNWIGEVMLESDTEDRIVCGTAVVNNKLEFLAGGKNQAGTVFVKTFRWNTQASVAVPYMACWQLSSGGVEDQNKQVRGFYFAGKLTSGRVKIYGYDSATDIDVDAIEAGTGMLLDISVGTQTKSQRLARQPAIASNMALFTGAVSGTYAGSGTPDRTDSLVLEFITTGPRR